MSTLPILGAPLHWEPWALALLLAAVSPGIHLVLSPLVERRSVTWRDDYPAVLVGDPLLAVGAGLALWLADGELTAAAHWIVGLLTVVGMVAFGAWQSRAELAAGRYTRDQIVAPTKLFHQCVVYPVLGYLVPAATIAGLANADESPWIAAAIIACLVGWGLTLADALANPRTGHGQFDWTLMRPPGPTPLAGGTESTPLSTASTPPGIPQPLYRPGAGGRGGRRRGVCSHVDL